MKKVFRTLIMMAMAVLLLTTIAYPALATGTDYDFDQAIAEFTATALNTTTLEISEKHTPIASVWTGGSNCRVYSSDETVVTVSKNGTVTAVGEGTAYVAFVVDTMEQVYRYDVVSEKASSSASSMLEWTGSAMTSDDLLNLYKSNSPTYQYVNTMRNITIILIILIVVAGLGAIIYIFVEAPKCGMSRLWALMPLFSSILGLLVFIVVRSNRKAGHNAKHNTFVCPVCNCVHPVGTTHCSICGTNFQ